MPKNRSLAVIAVVAVALYALTAVITANYAGYPPDLPAPAARPTPSVPTLAIAFASPMGDVYSSTPVTVAFTHPMVPVEQVGIESAQGIIRFSPPIEGTFCWIGQSILTFRPKTDLPIAAGFAAIIPAGTRALNGLALREDHAWSFATPGLQVVRHELDGRQHDATSTQPRLLVEFNQPVDLAEVQRCAAVIRNDNREKVNVQVARPDDKQAKEWPNTESTVLLSPAIPLPHKTGWQFVLHGDLAGKAGPRPLGERWAFAFHVCPPFRLSSVNGFAEPSGRKGIQIGFSNPVDPASIPKDGSAFTVSPPVKIHSPYQEYSGHVLLGDFEIEHEYKVDVAGSVRDVFGNSLGQRMTFRVRIPDYEPAIFLSGYRGYVERIGPMELPMGVVNLPVIGVEMLRIDEDDVVPYLIEERKEEGRAWPEAHSRMGIYRRMTGTTEKEKFRVVQVPLDWTFRKEQGGFMFLRAKAKRPEKFQKFQRPDRPENEKADPFVVEEAVLQVTDIGLTCKTSPENTLIWTTSLHSGQPLLDVAVAMRNAENKVVWQGTTDERGVAVGPGIDLSYDAKPTFLIAKQGRDMAYLALDHEQVWLGQFNIPRDWNPLPNRTVAHIFTDRGLYKAGETVHVKGAARIDTAEGIRLPKAKTINVTVTDPRGKKTLTRKLTLSAFGTFHFDVDLKKSAALGYYGINAQLQGHPEGDAAYGSFQVAAFRPAEFEVTVKPDQKEYVAGQTYRAQVEARYLFGAPMRGGELDWHAYWSPAWFTPKGCDGYRFGDAAGYYDSDPQLEHDAASGAGTLSAEGTGAIEFPLQPKGRIAGALNCELSVTVTDPTHQTVSASTSAVVHTAAFYLGVKKHSYIVTAKEPVAFEFIAAAPDGKRTGDVSAKVRVVRRQWHTVRKKAVWSGVHYETEAVDETVANTNVQITEQGAKWTFTPPKSGCYYLEISAEDKEKRVARTIAHFYATGEEYVSWRRDDTDGAELVADRDEYAVGDTARVLIQSPYEKTQAILTIERQGVMEQRLLDLQTTSPTVEIPIKREYLPNVYVSVVLVQGRTTDKISEDGADLGKPAYKVGYIELPVRNDAARLNVAVTPDRETAAPGETLTVNLRVTDCQGVGRRAEVAFIAADEGVLKLIGYQTPDPIAAIYASRALAVRTSETRRSILGRTRFDWLGKKGKGPGDGAELGEVASAFGGDVFRKTFLYTACYRPSIMTDADGRATVTFKLPDNLTRFRLMAVAVGEENLFGSGESAVTVKKPILLRSALPRFVNAGDRFTARALVHNDSDTIQKVQTELETEGEVRILGEAQKPIILNPGECYALGFPVEIGDPGTATFRFSARAERYADGLEISVPVNYPAPYLTMVKEGSTAGTTTENIQPPEAHHIDVGDVEIIVSASRLCELGEGLSYLLQYPYGCIEQTSSTTLVLAALRDLLPAIAAADMAPKDVDEKVEHGINRILSMQTWDGGFSYWPGANESTPWASCYAAFTLFACRRAGYEVPDEEFNHALNYLAEFLRSGGGRRGYADQATQCMMLYTLSMAQRPERDYHEVMAREAKALPIFAKAFLAMAIHRADPTDPMLSPLVAALNNYVDGKIPAKDRNQTDDLASIMDSEMRTRGIVLSALLQICPNDDRIGRVVDSLMRGRKHGRWMSTQENAFCLLALADYVVQREGDAPDFTAVVKAGNRVLGEKRFASRKEPVLCATLSMAEAMEAGGAFRLEKEGKGTLFYRIRTRFLPVKTERPPVDRGIRIIRQYQPFAPGRGTVSQEFEAGELIKVHLMVTTGAPRHYVVIDDPLPAGLEAVDASFATTGADVLSALRQGGWSHFNHIEQQDDRVLLFADWLPAGVHEHTYIARATTPGRFALPAARAEEMYTPTTCGESESTHIIISPKVD
ncbi:MAG: MG2 domain-containing protein [Planctomycetota bacterium]